MKYENKYYCDDCEIEMNKINKYGLHDLCDKCELFYQIEDEEDETNVAEKFRDYVKGKGYNFIIEEEE